MHACNVPREPERFEAFRTGKGRGGRLTRSVLDGWNRKRMMFVYAVFNTIEVKL